MLPSCYLCARAKYRVEFKLCVFGFWSVGAGWIMVWIADNICELALSG